MYRYPAKPIRDDNGTILAKLPNVPEVVTALRDVPPITFNKIE